MIKRVYTSLLAVTFGVALIAAAANAAKVYVPVGPKLLTVVAGRPFESVPASGSSKVSLTMCAEESEPAVFTVRYAKPLTEVRVAAVGDFVGPGTISRANIRVSRVEGDRLYSRVSQSSGAVFTLSDIGPQPTQFLVDVTVPRRTPPGAYKGAIGFYYQNKTFDVVSVDVNVLPLRLVGSSKQYAVYTSYGPGDAGMTAEDYGKFLAAWANMGFRSVTVDDSADQVPQELSTYTSAGLGGLAPLTTYASDECSPTVDEVTALQKAGRAAGLSKMMFFCVDNPTTPEQIEAAQQQLLVFQQARATSAARISTQEAYDALEPLLSEIDYHVAMPNVQSYISGKARPEGVKWQWYWWDARESTVAADRINAGIALWRSGLYGCTPSWMPQPGVAGQAPRTPLEELDSMKVLAMREGIDDTRYLTTFYKALREVKDLKRAKDKDYLESTEGYVNAFLAKPIDQVTMADVAAFRAKVAQYSIDLNKRL